MLFSFLAHAFHFFFTQAGRGCDGDILTAPGGLILGCDFQDTIGVDIKGHIYLRNTARGGGDAVEDEFTQRFIVHGHWAFTLQHVDLHLGLAVAGC